VKAALAILAVITTPRIITAPQRHRALFAAAFTVF
jgi:hypothetical protein